MRYPRETSKSTKFPWQKDIAVIELASTKVDCSVNKVLIRCFSVRKYFFVSTPPATAV